MSKEEYQDQMKELIKILSEWDPYSLIASGAPADEYESEAALVISGLQIARTLSEISLLVKKVFEKQFNETDLDVDDVSKKIFDKWKTLGWL